jgi:UDP-4-amino-4,6-dideoxy-N-acetyl-beta-L-altrosamine N-acetyltransferase
MTEIDVRLRKITEDDLEKIMRWRMKPSVTKYMNTDPQLTLGDQKKWLKSIADDPTCKYWMIVADGTDIGIIGIIDIDERNRRCSWIWYIGEDGFRGKGIAKRIQLNLYDYVFYTRGLHRLWSHILAFNVHEITNVHEAVGYKVEGVMKDHIYKNGEYIDVVVMGITADQWDEIRGGFEYAKVEFTDG